MSRSPTSQAELLAEPDAPAAAELDLQVVIRPERVRLVDDEDFRPDNAFDAVVLGRAYLGEAFTYTLRCNDVLLRVVVRDMRRLEVGEKAVVYLPPAHCRLVGSGGFKPRIH